VKERLFDVAVVGGGPGGTATAIALARAGARVVLFERSEYAAVRYGETLPPRARLPLIRLGVWDAFLRQEHAPSPAIASAWGEDVLYESHFICNPYGHGWHIDRRRLDEGLAVAAAEAGACVMRGARAISCRPGAPLSWRVEFISDGVHRSLQADFFVDATGRASALARARRVKRLSYDRLVGIVSTFSEPCSAQDQDGRTLVEAVEGGWWYSARLPDSRLVVAYMTDADLMRKAKGQLATYYERLLEDAPHTRTRMNGRMECIELVVMPANSSRLERATGANWLAVGDAAMAQDPLSSQGIYRALESGIEAAEAIGADATEKADAIQRYELRLRRVFDAYLRRRTTYYRRETRWRQSAFWTRRRSAAGTLLLESHNDCYPPAE
jgi:flavin-dependent dehydrogenase